MRNLFIFVSLLVLSACQNKSQNTELSADTVGTSSETDTLSGSAVNLQDTPQNNIPINTWADLKRVAPANAVKEFRLDDYSMSTLPCLDSSVFGKEIRRLLPMTRSSYIVSVKPNIGKFYPCVIYGEDHDAGKITEYIMLVMFDSTFQETPQMEDIAGDNSDPEGSQHWVSILEGNSLITTNSADFNCADEEGNPLNGTLARLNTEEHYTLTAAGKIELVKSDTTLREFCIDESE